MCSYYYTQEKINLYCLIINMCMQICSVHLLCTNMQQVTSEEGKAEQ